MYEFFNSSLDKYDLIASGEKIKTLCLKKQNPTSDHVLCVHYRLPKELDFEKYIDRSAQFDKVFMKPLRTILKAINWDERKVNRLFG